jgi:peptidyl-dipeptidase A
MSRQPEVDVSLSTLAETLLGQMRLTKREIVPLMIAALALVSGPCQAQEQDHLARPRTSILPGSQPTLAQPPSASSGQAPTAEDAKAFIAKAEAQGAEISERSNRVDWVASTFITNDTNWLEAKVGAEFTALQVALAKQAATFDHVDVDPVTRRKLDLLKRSLIFPAPDRPGAAEELANLYVKLETAYATAKITYKGRELTTEDVADILRTSRDPNETKTLWEAWQDIAVPMRADYARRTSLSNEGARGLGYADTGVLWRSWYDMPPEQFVHTIDRLWSQVEPLYKKLHCYARARLNEKYGDAVQPRTGPIRADLLGNMYGLTWSNIYDVLAPKNLSLGYDLTEALQREGYDAIKIVKTAENFYKSIGFTPLPDTFWSRSMFTRPRDREVDCHASAWDVDNKEDLRIKVCFRVNHDDFYTAHHELGHNFYQRAYEDQSYLFQDGANDGFHEAIGDFIGLYSETPSYLKEIGLIDTIPGPDADIPYLLRVALDKVAFLPFAYIVDKWRWQEFAGDVTPEHYNDSWWTLRTKYQGMMPPAPRSADAFDVAAKSHVPEGTPYARYFLATIYQFQFYRAACGLAGWTGRLNRCSIYGDKDVGKHFQAMLRMGASRPWPDALETFTGERDIDASAIVEYFAPLDRWLTEQDKGETCGW